MIMKIHESITVERIIESNTNSMFGTEDEGICLACGESQYGVEPDASKHRCHSCERNQVYGAQELLFHVIG